MLLRNILGNCCWWDLLKTLMAGTLLPGACLLVQHLAVQRQSKPVDCLKEFLAEFAVSLVFFATQAGAKLTIHVLFNQNVPVC